MRHAYRRPGASRTANVYHEPPTRSHSLHQYTDDEEEPPVDDDETAVATDLSALPPPPAQTNRAGFNENPVSHQVLFDKDESPASVAPQPKRVAFSAAPVQPHPPARASPVLSEQHSTRNLRLTPSTLPPIRSWSPSRNGLDRPRQIPNDEDDSDDDTLVTEPYIEPSSRTIRQTALRSSDDHRQTSNLRQPWFAEATSDNGSRSHFNDGMDDVESDVDEDDDLTAVGTGVATDLSLDDEPWGVPPTTYRAQPAFVHSGAASSRISVSRAAIAQPRTLYRPPSPLNDLMDFSRALPTAIDARRPLIAQRRASPLSSRSESPVVTSRSHVIAQPSPPVPPFQPPAPPPISRASSVISNSTASSVSSASSTSSLTRAQGGNESPLERELIGLLKEMNFSVALKDLHDHLSLGVQRTLVTEDGQGRAHVKVHCSRAPRPDVLARDPHLSRHWVNVGDTRWDFRTESHNCAVVFLAKP